MSLRFSPISSPGATRDLFVDLSAALEADEVLSVATVESHFPVTLAVSNVATNEVEVQFGGRTTPIGKGVHFSVSTVQESQAEVPIVISFEGDRGTTDKYEIRQPIVTALRN